MNDDNNDITNGQTPQIINGQDTSPKPVGNDGEKETRLERETRKTKEKLKEEKEAEKIKGDLEHSSAVNRSLLIFFLLAMTYFLVIVASTKDLQLLLPNSNVQLPILSVDIDLKDFYRFSPFILIVIHFNFLFSLCQHTKKLTRLKELENDVDDPLPHSSFLINLLIKPKTIREKGKVVTDYRVPYYLIRLLLWIVIYIYPLAILVLFQQRFADYHSLWITFLHLLYIVLDVILLSFFWVRISTPSFQNKPFGIFRDSGSIISADTAGQGVRRRKAVCEKGRDKIDKILLFFPCLIQETLCYLRNNTGTVNLVIIFLLVLVQVRTFGILKYMDYLSPGTAYRFVNNHPFFAPPRLKVIGKPIVSHYRKLELPLPYSDSFDSLKKSIESSKGPNNQPEESTSKINQLILSGRDLRFAILDRSDLKGVVLNGAQLQGASLMETIIDKANMTKANLEGANLKWSRLQNARLSEAHLEEAILEGAHMEDAIIIKAYLDGADLTDAKLNRAQLSDTSFVGSIMKGAELKGVSADRALFRAADLSHVDFSPYNTGAGGKEEITSLKGAEFFASDLGKTIFKKADLTNAVLRAANLEGSDLNSAVLRDADLYAANLRDIQYDEKINLTGAKLHSSQIKGVGTLKELIKYGKARVYGVNVFKAKSKGEKCDNIVNDSDLHDVNEDQQEEIKNGVKIICVDDQGRPVDPPLEFQIQEIIYRLRSKIACDNVYTAKGIMRQLLFDKDLEYQRQRLKDELGKNCPEIADQMGPH
jgi:uncharacterized protein YjbI with pentapeptide repeats